MCLSVATNNAVSTTGGEKANGDTENKAPKKGKRTRSAAGGSPKKKKRSPEEKAAAKEKRQRKHASERRNIRLEMLSRLIISLS